MAVDGGRDDVPGLARRLGTALAILLFIGLAGATVRQAARLNPLSGGSSRDAGSLEVRAAADRDSEAPSLPPPAGGQWEVIPRSDLAPRSDPVTVWTGREVFVWGGWEGEPPRRIFSDGALYDPVTRDWSSVPFGPPRGWQEGAVGVWTGAEVLILGGRHSIGREPLAQAYDPARATWNELPRPPAGRWLWQTAVWTGSHVVVAEESEGSTPGTLRYDPQADRWEQGGGLSTMRMDPFSRAVWLDGQMVVSGQVPGSSRLMVQSFDPTGSAWRRGRGAPPEREWLAAMAADEAAGDVIMAGPVPGQAPEFLAARWNPREGWRVLPEVPAALRNGRPPRLFATPAGPVLWPEGPTPPSVLIDGAWRPLPRAPRDKNFGEAVVWTAHGLFAWGGHAEEHSAGGALFRTSALPPPAATGPPRSTPEWEGTWRSMPKLPDGLAQASLFPHPGGIAAYARTPAGEWAAWRLTGSEWELAGVAGRQPEACVAHLGLDVYVLGRDSDADAWRASALNVLDGTARALPPPPVPVRGMVACGAWGTRVALMSLSGDGGAGAVFDPVTQGWTALPSLPPAGLLTGMVTAGSDDVAPLLLLTELTVARLDPGGEWHLSSTPRNAFAASGPSVAWAGDRLLVWGGTAKRGLHGGWAWDAGRMVWGQIPEAWIAGTAEPSPHAWSGRRWVVWGQSRPSAQAAAAYEPATRQWHHLPPSGSTSPAIAAVWDVDLVVLRADGTVERFDPAGAR